MRKHLLVVPQWASTHGIVIQEVKDDASTQLLTTEMPTVQKYKRRTVKSNIIELRPCFARPKVGPALEIISSKPQMNVELDNFIWFVSRYIGSSLEVQTVTSWAGRASQTAGTCDDVCLRVEYIPPINFSIHDNVTLLYWNCHRQPIWKLACNTALSHLIWQWRKKHICLCGNSLSSRTS